MSIAAIVTGGYGSFGGISAVAKQGFSSYVGLAEPPLAGKQYITLTSVNSLSHLNGTAAAVGDIETCDLVASLTTGLLQDSGYPISITANGVAAINSGGDQGRLFFGRDLYDVSLLAFDTTIQGTIVVNNLPPVSTAYWPSALAAITLVRNVAMTPIDFSPGFTDPESDAIVITFESTPTAPVITASETGDTTISVALTTQSIDSGAGTPGVDFSSNVLSGTPTAAIGSYATAVRATDAFGEFTGEAQQIHIVGSVLAGSASWGFTPTATLTGTGALLGSTAIVFTASAAMENASAGALNAFADVLFTATAVLSGGGALAGSAGLSFTPSATLIDATTNFSGACSVSFAPVAVLSNVSLALTGLVEWSFTLTATLNAAVAVPNVVAAAIAAAVASIEAVSLVAAVEYDYSNTVAVDDVISQSPVAGSMVIVDSTVTIFVSLGALLAQDGAPRGRRVPLERHARLIPT